MHKRTKEIDIVDPSGLSDDKLDIQIGVIQERLAHKKKHLESAQQYIRHVSKQIKELEDGLVKNKFEQSERPKNNS
tara:strand:- start:689 stop:916 length:228 start_codon:yes stop_codon:yes gene_type:complete